MTILLNRSVGTGAFVDPYRVADDCPCGVFDCGYFEMGYPYCWGCDDHHRAGVCTLPEGPCPVDLMEWDWCMECGDYRSNGECPHRGYARPSVSREVPAI